MKEKRAAESASREQENYIEAIDELIRTHGVARTVDVSRKLGVRAASVSEAVSRLVKRGMAVRKSWHEIELTQRGRRIARDLDQRHAALRRFMVECLEMSENDADGTACLVEHFVGAEFAGRLVKFMKKSRGSSR